MWPENTVPFAFAYTSTLSVVEVDQSIFISSLFKKNRNYLGLNKFKIISGYTEKNVVGKYKDSKNVLSIFLTSNGYEGNFQGITKLPDSDKIAYFKATVKNITVDKFGNIFLTFSEHNIYLDKIYSDKIGYSPELEFRGKIDNDMLYLDHGDEIGNFKLSRQ